MMFEKIFNLVNKLFELDNEPIYFNGYIPECIAPVLLSENEKYDLYNKVYKTDICDKLYLYIIKSNSTFNKICIDQSVLPCKKSIILSVDDKFLEGSIKSVINIVENIYEFIFKQLDKEYSMDFDIDVMKKIFTIFTINRYMGNLNMKNFELGDIISEDMASHILKDYDIRKLYDDNYIYILNLIMKSGMER